MKINKMALFERTKARWPTVVDLNGMLINGKQVRGTEIPWELYSAIEESIDVNDDWNQVAIWAFHQALPEYSDEEIKNGNTIIHPQAVDFQDFEQNMCDNLDDDSWAEHRKLWD